MAKTKHVKLYSNPLNRFLVDLIWITKTTAPFLLITGRTRRITSCSSFWRINNVGCWCTFLRTIKVEHGAGGRRVPRHPRNLAVRQTARMSRKAVCTTDGWSVQLTSYFSGLALSLCLIIIPTWEWGCVLCCVCGGGYLFFFRGGLRLGCAAGKCEHACMMFDFDYVWNVCMYEHMKVWWSAWTQSVCTHIERIF